MCRLNAYEIVKAYCTRNCTHRARLHWQSCKMCFVGCDGGRGPSARTIVLNSHQLRPIVQTFRQIPQAVIILYRGEKETQRTSRGARNSAMKPLEIIEKHSVILVEHTRSLSLSLSILLAFHPVTRRMKPLQLSFHLSRAAFPLLLTCPPHHLREVHKQRCS